ncbi:hypothetical protein OG21DRAFT_784229 [Imleria badia]|nr:hypothetical protein OG21DRAFT_784229 [Imleria badia]
MARFERLGELSDLEDAISRHKAAVDFTPESHPYKPTCLNNLGNVFLTRFERLGELNDLEDAISRHRDAVDLAPHSHPREPGHLNNLGSALLVRFRCLGEGTDLDDAIGRHMNAVDLIPDGHPNKPSYIHDLGTTFFTRFQRLGELSDLEDAISRYRDAIHLIPHDHPHNHGHLNNFGCALLTRFERLGELSDLEDAISRHRNAVDLTPHGHPHKPGHLTNLGSALLARFRCFGELSDLEDAISRYGDAVDLIPDGHPDKPTCLHHLGHSFVARFECLGDPTNLERAISLYSRVASACTGPIRVRFQASHNWISCARCARRMHHHTHLHAYSVAISLIPELAWIGLSHSHRYFQLGRDFDVVREAAAAALDSKLPETAMVWLEQGRSVVWGELFQLRSSYEELSVAHPDHARRLQELSATLEHAAAKHEISLVLSEKTSSATWCASESLQQDADNHRALAIERDKLLQEIRGLPGFAHFPPRKEFCQLRASAHSGPVVVLNAAKSRCDALIVLSDLDHVIHVPLPTFTFQRSAGLQNMLEKLLGHARSDDRKGDPAPLRGVSWESLLSTLWNGVVRPVLDALAFSTPDELSRIFWCPTGPFVFLPIHAAGLYGTQHSQPGHKVFDFVISSYVPTLSSLTLSPNPPAVPSGDLRLLTVRQPPSDGLPHLSAQTILLESSVGTVEEVLSLRRTRTGCTLHAMESKMVLIVDFVLPINVV